MDGRFSCICLDWAHKQDSGAIKYLPYIQKVLSLSPKGTTYLMAPLVAACVNSPILGWIDFGLGGFYELFFITLILWS